MRVGYITFCGSIGFNIKDDKYKKDILEEIYKKTEMKIIQKHFNNIQKKHFKKLNEIPHLISLKSNGNPYFLYLTKYNHNNVCIFIDKKIQQGYFLPRMIIVYLRFSNILFDNTLIEGEMIKDNNNNWLFLVNDIYIYKNVLLNKINIINRLEILHNIFKNNYENYELAICDIQIKKYFKYNQINYMSNEFKNSLNYTNRGIYFTPLYFKFKNILYNFDNSLINNVKRKKYQNNTDFYTNASHDNNQNNNNQNNNNQNNINLDNNIDDNNLDDNNLDDNNLDDNNLDDNNLDNNNLDNNNLDNNNLDNNNLDNNIDDNIDNNIDDNNIDNNIDDNNNDEVIIKTFYLEKTDMPDVYIMYDLVDNEYIKMSDMPIISNMKTSKYIKELFKNEIILAKKKIECVKCIKNGKIKWKPIIN